MGILSQRFSPTKIEKKFVYQSMAKRHQMLMYLHYSRSIFLVFKVLKSIGKKKLVPGILEPHLCETNDRVILD